METPQLQCVTDQLPAFSIDQAAAALTAAALDLDFCRRWVLSRIHPPGPPRCPECAVAVQGAKPQESWRQDRRVCCNSCGRYFSNRSGTFLQGSRLGWRPLFLITALSGHGLPVDPIARAAGVHPDTVRHWTRAIAALTGDHR